MATAKNRKLGGAIPSAHVHQFDKIRAQIRQLATDIEALSKKSPDNPVSKFKLTFINEMLRGANFLLLEDFRPIQGFSEFEDSALPSASDVVMVLSQYLTCLERWRSHNVRKVNFKWYWNSHDEQIPTEAPTGFRASDD